MLRLDYNWRCQRANKQEQLCSVAYSSFGNHTRQPKGNVVTDTAPICGGRVGDCRAAGIRGPVVDQRWGFGLRGNTVAIGSVAASAFANACAINAARGSRGRQRLAWMVLAIGLAGWTAGHAVWCYVSLGGIRTYLESLGGQLGLPRVAAVRVGRAVAIPSRDDSRFGIGLLLDGIARRSVVVDRLVHSGAGSPGTTGRTVSVPRMLLIAATAVYLGLVVLSFITVRKAEPGRKLFHRR